MCFCFYFFKEVAPFQHVEAKWEQNCDLSTTETVWPEGVLFLFMHGGAQNARRAICAMVHPRRTRG